MIDADTKIKLKLLTQLIAPGAELVRTWPLKGGISATMVAMEIQMPNGVLEKMISRRPGTWELSEKPDIAAQDFRMLQALQNSELPVPRPIFLDAEAAVFEKPSLVVEFVEGSPDYDPSDMDHYVNRFAETLFSVHQTDAADFDFLPRTWEVRTQRLERGVDQFDHAQGEEHIRETLKVAMQTRASGSQVLLHGDFWPGNTMWQGGELTHIIDWEDAEIGNPLWDIAVSRSELLFAFGFEAMDAFTSAYQAVSGNDLADLAFWDLCASLRPMNCFADWAAAWPALGRTDVTEASSRARHLKFVTQAMEKLEP